MKELFDEFNQAVFNEFEMKTWALMSQFLNIEIQWEHEGTCIPKKKYAREENLNIINCTPTNTPTVMGLKLLTEGDLNSS